MVAGVARAVPVAWACTTERLEADVCTLAGQLSAATCRWLLLIGELDRREGARAVGMRVDGAVAVVEVRARRGRGPSTRPGRPSSDAAAGHLRPVRSRRVVVFQSAGADPHRDACAPKRSWSSSPRSPPRRSSSAPIRTYERVSVNRDTAAAQVAARRRDGPSRRRRHGHHRGSPPPRRRRNGAERVDAGRDGGAGRSRPRFRGIAARRRARTRGPLLPRRERGAATDRDRRPRRRRPAHRSRPITGTRTAHLRHRPPARRPRGRRHQTGRSPHPDRPRRTTPHHRGPRPRLPVPRLHPPGAPPRASHRAVRRRRTDRRRQLSDLVRVPPPPRARRRLAHHGDSAESPNLTFIGPHGRTVNEIGERPRPAHERLPVDSTIDADTIATAEGGRCDLDLAITAIASISTSERPATSAHRKADVRPSSAAVLGPTMPRGPNPAPRRAVHRCRGVDEVENIGR